ncbi:MAG: DUF2946 domain-containing protein [Alphaproteobacteria bacterium]|nr:DUF2946 domain-containing protein [Alphaproteobacteria bacterium]
MTSGRAASFRRFAAQLTLALFALRALVPVGYMPDFGTNRATAADGQVRIVICTGFGSKSILVDEAGNPAADQDDSQPGHGDCPFGTASGAAFLTPEPAMAPVHAGLAKGFVPPAGAQALPPPAQGPPLGQRAPPIRLG